MVDEARWSTSQHRTIQRCTHHLVDHLDVCSFVKYGVAMEVISLEGGQKLVSERDRENGQLKAVLLLLELLKNRRNCLSDLLLVLRRTLGDHITSQHPHYKLVTVLECNNPHRDRGVVHACSGESGCVSDHSHNMQGSLPSLNESYNEHDHIDSDSLSQSTNSEMVTGKSMKRSTSDTFDMKSKTLPSSGRSKRYSLDPATKRSAEHDLHNRWDTRSLHTSSSASIPRSCPPLPSRETGFSSDCEESVRKLTERLDKMEKENCELKKEHKTLEKENKNLKDELRHLKERPLDPNDIVISTSNDSDDFHSFPRRSSAKQKKSISRPHSLT